MDLSGTIASSGGPARDRLGLSASSAASRKYGSAHGSLSSLGDRAGDGDVVTSAADRTDEAKDAAKKQAAHLIGDEEKKSDGHFRDDPDGDQRMDRTIPQGAAAALASYHQRGCSKPSKNRVKEILTIVFALVVALLLLDTVFSPPEKRILQMNRVHDFLRWVRRHPSIGSCAFVVVYGLTVVLLLPGTPLTLGGGYVYKAAYGWVGGILLATLTSVLGSLLGSVTCFILGRYFMREKVRKWSRRYPLFDAIDLAVADNGFKIMSLLYLTPILPLGPVSYMCGTTSMRLASFAAAKVAACPLMIMYVFIGASTGTIVSEVGSADGDGTEGEDFVVGGTNTKMMIFGICLSVVSIATVSHFVKKELYKIFERQKEEKEKEKREAGSLTTVATEDSVEVGLDTAAALHRRRAHTSESHQNVADDD